MNKRIVFVGLLIVLSLTVLSASGGVWGKVTQVRGAAPAAAELVQIDPEKADQSSAAAGTLVTSYAAKFVCTEPLPPGTFFYGKVAPIVQQKTDVLIHNPNDYAITVYKKAVRSYLEDAPAIQPGAWKKLDIGPDGAVRVDCDDVAKLLTGNPNATFIGTYGIGVTVEGFVVVDMGPQTVAGTTLVRYSPLDVTAEYVRSTEVMKKDVNFQPWWRYWWWALPWRLAYPYQRLLPIADITQPIDCKDSLILSLHNDVEASTMSTDEKAQTHVALDMGRMYDPNGIDHFAEIPPALVTIIGQCAKVNTSYMTVDYLLVSNIHPLIPAPPAAPVYDYPHPWIVGGWYDLPVVSPQNISMNIDIFFRDWHTQQWIAAYPTVDPIPFRDAMTYFFPYWCGWGHWSWWGGERDCVDIAVGAGESLDVEQVTPVRVIMSSWPPVVSQ